MKIFKYSKIKYYNGIRMICESTEVNYYAKIMKNLAELEDDSEKKDIWKSKSIIELMDLSKEVDDDDFTQKALLNILTIYKFINENPTISDTAKLEKFSDCEKEKILELLKEEIYCLLN
jgi:hypothetical protein